MNKPQYLHSFYMPPDPGSMQSSPDSILASLQPSKESSLQSIGSEGEGSEGEIVSSLSTLGRGVNMSQVHVSASLSTLRRRGRVWTSDAPGGEGTFFLTQKCVLCNQSSPMSQQQATLLPSTASYWFPKMCSCLCGCCCCCFWFLRGFLILETKTLKPETVIQLCYNMTFKAKLKNTKCYWSLW